MLGVFRLVRRLIGQFVWKVANWLLEILLWREILGRLVGRFLERLLGRKARLLGISRGSLGGC